VCGTFGEASSFCGNDKGCPAEQPWWLQSLHTGHKLNTHTFLTCRNQRCGQTLTWKFQYWELRTDQQLECWVHFNAPYTTDIQPHSLIPLFHHFWFIRY
jgi:hypothetical protein